MDLALIVALLALGAIAAASFTAHHYETRHPEIPRASRRAAVTRAAVLGAVWPFTAVALVIIQLSPRLRRWVLTGE